MPQKKNIQADKWVFSQTLPDHGKLEGFKQNITDIKYKTSFEWGQLKWPESPLSWLLGRENTISTPDQKLLANHYKTEAEYSV